MSLDQHELNNSEQLETSETCTCACSCSTSEQDCCQSEDSDSLESTTTNSTSIAYLAGGCFWGIDHYFSKVKGVISTQSGYAQSQIENPTYEQVCNGSTDAVECVKITFDPSTVSLLALSLLLIDIIDPYSINRQGNDEGRQYRSGFYYLDKNQQETYQQALDLLSKRTQQQAAIEVEALTNFFPAENYHQDYLDKNPQGYCHIPLDKISQVSERQKYIERIYSLNPQQYSVTQESDTEEPFTNEYDHVFEEGIYVDIVSGKPLFTSTDKFDSGCGWPAFSKPIEDTNIIELPDNQIPGRPRTEVRTAQTQIHLGHVFTDGPQERGGLRYCINSAALRFIPKERMEEEGYASYLPLLEQ